MTKAMFVYIGIFALFMTYQFKAYQLFFFTETCCLFLAETFLSLKHFGRLSHSCIKTCC